ncbi:MAG TPA: hypothetical protein VF170_14170 [Planctomycetaceae bacterium]
MNVPQEPLRLAEHVRTACLRAAVEAYEDAGLSGLCPEGRWERALDAIRSLSLASVVRNAGVQGGGGT